MLLRIPQVAASLGLHRDTIYRMIRRGVLPAVVLTMGPEHGQIRVRQADLDRWMADLPRLNDPELRQPAAPRSRSRK
jgi:excisionase family DNA binding protein